MANKLLNFRCPDSLLGAIDKIGREYYPADNDSGCDRSKTLINILVAGVETLTNGEFVLQKPSAVKQVSVRQVPLADIKAMVEAVIEEKLKQLPVQKSVQTEVQIPPNFPTRNEFHDLKELVNGYKLSLMREIQNRDKSINILAEQVAELTARLDAMPSEGIDKETLSTAKGTVLRNWKTESAPEKKERIEQAPDKFIDIVSPPDTNTKPQPETAPEVARTPESKNKIDWKVGDKCSVKMPSGVIIWGAEIVSINKNGTCGILVRDTNTHFPADLADLIVPEPDSKPDKKPDKKLDSKSDISSRPRKRKPLTAWEEWEEICTDNIIELDELWHEK